jgi:hypothetical protein
MIKIDACKQSSMIYQCLISALALFARLSLSLVFYDAFLMLFFLLEKTINIEATSKELERDRYRRSPSSSFDGFILNSDRSIGDIGSYSQCTFDSEEKTSVYLYMSMSSDHPI